MRRDLSTAEYLKWLERRLADLEARQTTPLFGRGVLDYARVTTGQGSITAAVDLTGLSVTVTVPAGRLIRITGDVQFSSTAASDTAQLMINEGGTQLQARPAPLAAAGTPSLCIAVVVITPTAGAHTYKLRASRAGGSGTISMGASSTVPAHIVVEDVGAAL